MKKILLTMLLAISSHAANFTWTATFTGDPQFSGTPDMAPSWNGTVGKIEITKLGDAEPFVLLTLEPAFLPPAFSSMWAPSWTTPLDSSYYLYPGVEHSIPAWLTTFAGTETWLKPFWTVDGWQNQGWWAATIGDPVEWEDPVEPPIDPPVEPPGGGGGGGGGGGEIPEPSTYALLSALGLLGFALRRRLCQE